METEWLINSYVKGEIPDYQMSAYMMAVYFKGMSAEETSAYTDALINSGERLDLSMFDFPAIDKHSSGGVGDKTTLILAPLVASSGVPVAKMSGRGLGHTGGTVDKLESIPGYRVSMTISEFIRQVKQTGIAVISQSGQLVPGDRMLYALRDVTATIESIPLIASSIMSKKIAAGAAGIVLDVKTGNGAFMRQADDAEKLAGAMVRIGKNSNRPTVALLTSMDQPLGTAIGNALEVREAFLSLRSQKDCPDDLLQLCLALGAEMLVLAGRSSSPEEAKGLLQSLWDKGKTLEAAEKWIEAQGGDPRIVTDPEQLFSLPPKKVVKADKSGFLSFFNTREVGRAAVLSGAGRSRKEDAIDMGAGIVLHKKLGDEVRAGDILAEIYLGSNVNNEDAVEVFENAVKITALPPKLNPLVVKRII